MPTVRRWPSAWRRSGHIGAMPASGSMRSACCTSGGVVRFALQSRSAGGSASSTWSSASGVGPVCAAGTFSMRGTTSPPRSERWRMASWSSQYSVSCPSSKTTRRTLASPASSVTFAVELASPPRWMSARAILGGASSCGLRRGCRVSGSTDTPGFVHLSRSHSAPRNSVSSGVCTLTPAPPDVTSTLSICLKPGTPTPAAAAAATAHASTRALHMHMPTC
mmetsp:Transcript_93268/g.241072  ORF Transcript_93268/g.241072 Transcript_93268/m.241072 type:complete len:221 (+) Transcript_93268:1491-2153(+)